MSRPAKITDSARGRLELSGFPVKLKADLLEICGDECCSITEFAKKVLRKAVEERKVQLAPTRIKAA